MLSETEYDSIMKTLHLLCSPANARRLLESIEQAESRSVVVFAEDGKS